MEALELNRQVKSTASDTPLSSDPTPSGAKVNGYLLYQATSF